MVSKFRRPGQEDVDIRLLAGDEFRSRPEDVGRLPLATSRGTDVLLGSWETFGRPRRPYRSSTCPASGPSW